MADFTGTGGDDVQDGTNDDDVFNYSQDGNDTLNGKGGNDAFQMGITLNPQDRINGGAGSFDVVQLFGASSPFSVSLNNTTMKNCEALQMSAGDYSVTIADGNVAAGAHFSVLASAATRMIFDGSAETDGFFTMDTSAGDDVLIGGQQADTISGGTPFFVGGNDTVRGEGGDDTLNFFDDLDEEDRANGGDGFDTLRLDGDYSVELILGNNTLSSIEAIVLDGAGPQDIYYLTFADGNVAAGVNVTVNATAALGVFLNGAAETNGSFSFLGSAETDVISGGAKDDVITAGLGNDLIGGAGGADLFVYPSVSDSTSTEHDHLVEFNANRDSIAVLTPVTGVDAAVIGGTLNLSNFDERLESKIDGTRLGADHAVLYQASAGELAGVLLLIVDQNGTGGYQAGEDLVLRLIDPLHLGSLDVGNFLSL
jgi:Ca2+-binding RTX toxin-like protein